MRQILVILIISLSTMVRAEIINIPADFEPIQEGIDASTDGDTVDLNGYASAMYDGIGRPFMFGTRTNGVQVWDRLRGMYGMDKQDYAAAEEALKKTVVGTSLLFWQPRNESFPPSPVKVGFLR